MIVSTVVAEFELTDGERVRLEEWSRQPSRLGTRARIVLACTEPTVVYQRLAREVDVSVITVSKVRARFAAERLDGLIERSRSGRPKAKLSITDSERELLSRWARKTTSAQALALRCRIVLAC